MRIELKSDGGVANFPGLSRAVVVDTNHLLPEECDHLSQLLTAAGFFDLPAVVGPPRSGAADYRKHTITVTQGPRKHTIEVFEPIANHALANLIEYLKRRRVPPR